MEYFWLAFINFLLSQVLREYQKVFCEFKS